MSIVSLSLAALLSAGLLGGQIIPSVETADADGDGNVTRAEYQASWRDFLMSGDKDGDGKISTSEWDSEAVKISKRMRETGITGWASIGHNGLRSLLDTNQDQYVTPAEIDTSTALRFGQFDTDFDGVISTAEVVAFRNRATGGVPPGQ